MNRIRYSVNLAYEVAAPGADFVFNIEAARTARQSVVSEALDLKTGTSRVHDTDAILATRLIRLHAPPGRLEVGYEAVVDIDHRLEEPSGLGETPLAELPFDVLPYLRPSRYCQSDRLLEFALREFGGMPPGYDRVVAINDWVRTHVRYVRQSSDENTSAVETLVSRTGVCRDYAHLMITLCRALNIPARFASSLDYGKDPSCGPTDFHAFVDVFLSGRWYVFDPSGISITTGLPRIGTGRDAADIPFAAIFGVVQPELPRLGIMAVTDDGREMPLFTARALSTW